VGCDLEWHLPPPRHRQRREPPEWRPIGPQPSWPTERQATDILVLVSTDIPVRFPLTFSCGFTTRAGNGVKLISPWKTPRLE
jgi:hypothetical protein